MRTFKDRVEAGRLLGRALIETGAAQVGDAATLVLGIPRGGVIVAAEVARALRAPLDVWLARKLGAPGNPELALGSVASNGAYFLNTTVLQALNINQAFLEQAILRERAELERRLIRFRGTAQPVDVRGKEIILVDDGAATGATVFSALAALNQSGAVRCLLALPVAPANLVPTLRAAADGLCLLREEERFQAVGQFYEHFEAVEDAQVLEALKAV